jgi:hypothetical protein
VLMTAHRRENWGNRSVRLQGGQAPRRDLRRRTCVFSAHPEVQEVACEILDGWSGGSRTASGLPPIVHTS